VAPQAVLDALGGSVAAGELKGDYAAAERAAAGALEDARTGGDPQALADAAIWGSIIATLRAAPGDAAARLEEASAAVPDAPLAPAVQAFTAAAERRMPDGNLAPPLLTAEPVSWPWPPKGDQLERELFALTWLPYRGWDVQAERDGPEPGRLREALEFGLRDLANIWDERPHARLAAAELCRHAGAQGRADEHLDAAVAAYAALGDAAGLAGCDLARGAWAAVAVGSPLTLGLELWADAVAGAGPVNRSDRILTAAPPATASAAHYRRAEAGFRTAGAPRGVAMVDLHRAAVAALGDDPQGAMEAAARARAAFERAGDAAHAQLAAAHGALAGIQARQWPERTDVAEAIGAWGGGPGSPGWAVGIGFLFSHAGWRWLRREGDADRALACLRLAEATFTALGAADLAQQTLADRAVTHQVAGELDAALAAAGRSVRGFASLSAEDPEVLEALAQREEYAASVTRWLAYRARDADRVELARPILERQQARFEAAAGWADAPAELAALAEETRAALESDSAMAPAFRALAARRINPLASRRELARALKAAGSVRDGERGRLEATVQLEWGDRAAGRAAFAAHPPPEPAGLDVLIADARLVTALEDWPEARRRHTALGKLRRDWWTQTAEPWSELADLARTTEGLGDFDRARDLYRRAIAEAEKRRGQIARRPERAVPPALALYGDAARAELAAGTSPEAAAAALALAERSRARGLLSDMARSATLATITRKHAKELREWRELTARVEMLTWLAARGGDDHAGALADAEASLEALESRLAAADPRWLDAVNPPAATLGAEEIRAALPEGVLLIEHLLVRGALLAWATTRDGPVQVSVRREDDVALDELQRKLWVACQGRSELWERFAQPLADALLAPFDDAIDAAGHVVLVPHRWGHQAPLQALPWRAAPLIASKTVSVLPSASALRLVAAGAPSRPGRLLAVGDPSNMSRRRPGEAEASGGFGALPWSGAQAAEAADLFGTDPLLGPKARERAVRKAIGGARLLHFATHGVLDAAPLLSCIVLAEGDTIDVWELLGLPLDADLVTISACDSAGSPDTPGGELVGLGWLTLAAGARAVVASLWKVSELSTALVMRAFYGALHTGQPPRAALAAAQRHVRGLTLASAQPEIEALQQAAKAAGRPAPTLPDKPPQDFSHPYHWAGFVLIGA
jgi:CHAT domain-containing protein